MPDPTRPPFDAAALLKFVADVGRTIERIEPVAPKSAAQMRELLGKLPQIADALKGGVKQHLAQEVAGLDRYLSHMVSGALDELLIAAQTRAPKERRIGRGERSPARQRARRR